jgi:sRNA-binding carbon storage regulator CsrA
MADHTLQVGDALLLGGDTRLTVLGVEGDTARLGITAPAGDRVVGPEAPEAALLWRAGPTSLPGDH